MQTIKLNPQILQELFDLISLMNSEETLELTDFHLTENSLTCKSLGSLNPDDLDNDLDDLIANWMDHSENPEVLYNFNWEIHPENNTITFNW